MSPAQKYAHIWENKNSRTQVVSAIVTLPPPSLGDMEKQDSTPHDCDSKGDIIPIASNLSRLRDNFGTQPFGTATLA